MVDKRELKQIMNQGATRPETPRDREERKLLEAEIDTMPSKGEPLRRRYRNFRPDADSAIRALGGPTIWMRRLRAIEDELDRHEQQLSEAWLALAAEVDDAAEFARQWQETAERWSFRELNHLIDRHNVNFPAEARLPMDPRTRDFVKINGREYRRVPLDAGWILERWPADLTAARASE